MKRFTETTKWQDPWFRKLPAKMKAFWLYLVDNCDLAGIWNPDMELAGFQIGEEFAMEEIHAHFADRITILENGRWFVPKFIEFQYGELNPANRCHASVIKALALNKCGMRNGKVGPMTGIEGRKRTDATGRAVSGNGAVPPAKTEQLGSACADGPEEGADGRRPEAGDANGVPPEGVAEGENGAVARVPGAGSEVRGEEKDGVRNGKSGMPSPCTPAGGAGEREKTSVETSGLCVVPSSCTPEEAPREALARASQGHKDKSKEQEQDREEGEPGEETNDEFLDRLKREFPGCDVDGEIRRLKQIADREGTALSRNRVLAWMKKASPRVKAASPPRPRFDTPKTADPPGWLDWVKATYGDDCQAYRNRQRFCDSPRDVREQFLRVRAAA